MISKEIIGIIVVLFSILLAGCITSIDDKLPYAQLPEIAVATQFKLMASPSHPTAYLSSDLIAAGEKVQVIGSDKNAAWLLVLHNNLLGWMPTFYSRTNVGALKPAIVIEPLSDKCTKYLGATFKPDEEWVSTVNGAAFVVGSIYRPQVAKLFDPATLALTINGTGSAVVSDYVHTPLTSSNAVILFGYSITGLQKGSRIRFSLSNPDNEKLFFQTAFFSNDCAAQLTQLPIGKTKIAVADQAGSPNGAAPVNAQQTPSFTPTPVIIQRESGLTKSNKLSGTPTANPAEIAESLNMQSVYENDFEDVLGTEWSKPVRDTTPNGQGFLGQFGNETITLRLSGIPEHSYVFLTFDLYVIRSWDGVRTDVGPDVWDLNVAGGPTLLHTTFSNADPLGNVRQSYPDPYPGGNQAARTGATDNSSLGYKFAPHPEYTDSVYRLTFDFSHSASTLELHFSASGLQALDDESWGIDNIKIYVRK